MFKPSLPEKIRGFTLIKGIVSETDQVPHHSSMFGRILYPSRQLKIIVAAPLNFVYMVVFIEYVLMMGLDIC